VLGLHFYCCDDCDAVHADVEVPPRCGRCAGTSFRDVTAGLQDASYFLPRDRRGTGD
jgi:hypothetical protein